VPLTTQPPFHFIIKDLRLPFAVSFFLVSRAWILQLPKTCQIARTASRKPLILLWGNVRLLQGNNQESGAFTDSISLGGSFPIIATAVMNIPACLFPQIN
jgi:hypothetical protein